MFPELQLALFWPNLHLTPLESQPVTVITTKLRNPQTCNFVTLLSSHRPPPPRPSEPPTKPFMRENFGPILSPFLGILTGSDNLGGGRPTSTLDRLLWNGVAQCTWYPYRSKYVCGSALIHWNCKGVFMWPKNEHELFLYKLQGSGTSRRDSHKSGFLGRGWGQQLFSFQRPAVQWIARTSSLNCLSCRNPYQTPHSLNCLPPFHWKPFFSLKSASSHLLPKNRLWSQDIPGSLPRTQGKQTVERGNSLWTPTPSHGRPPPHPAVSEPKKWVFLLFLSCLNWMLLAGSSFDKVDNRNSSNSTMFWRRSCLSSATSRVATLPAWYKCLNNQNAPKCSRRVLKGVFTPPE